LRHPAIGPSQPLWFDVSCCGEVSKPALFQGDGCDEAPSDGPWGGFRRLSDAVRRQVTEPPDRPPTPRQFGLISQIQAICPPTFHLSGLRSGTRPTRSHGKSAMVAIAGCEHAKCSSAAANRASTERPVSPAACREQLMGRHRLGQPWGCSAWATKPPFDRLVLSSLCPFRPGNLAIAVDRSADLQEPGSPTSRSLTFASKPVATTPQSACRRHPFCRRTGVFRNGSRAEAS